MIHFKKTSNVLILLFAMGILPSCNCYDNKVQEGCQVLFQLKHNVGTETLEFDTIKYENDFGNEYSVLTLRYFISDINLHKSDKEILHFDEIFYIDGSEAPTMSISPETKIPPGKYDAVSFTFGINKKKNVTGHFVNPPESKMEWPVVMGGAYHYMKLEGRHISGDLIVNFQAHTGQLDGIQYAFNVKLSNSSFNIEKENVTIEIIMDLNEWWTNPNTLDLNTITSIMGDSSIQRQLMENGADVFSFGGIQ